MTGPSRDGGGEDAAESSRQRAIVTASLLARTEALCAIPSPIGEERVLCDEVEGWARKFPRVQRVKNSLVIWVDEGRGDGGGATGAEPPPAQPEQSAGGGAGGAGAAAGTEAAGARPLVALCGHLDTVPVHLDDQGGPRRREGRLVAPGASDMKGGIAVAMELADRVPREARFCDLVLVLYSREEGPYEENELADVLREVPSLEDVALAICLEPTDGKLQLGCVGSIHASLTFTGRAAHSARPWQGENAVHKAGALLAHLGALAPREATSGGLAYHEVMSVTRIEGGRARNVVPDACALNLNFRFAPDKSLDAAAEEVRALAARFGAEVRLTDLSPAAPSFADHELVRRLVERTGAATEPKQAWTDVARLAAQGVPAVNFGPGATAQAHQRGEWVEVAALERCHRALAAFLAA